jgi:hypothetical protein
MPYGKKARNVRAYEFGCLDPPIEGEDAAMAQMRGRVKLWNQLVELEHQYHEKRDAIIAPFVVSDDEKTRKAERKAAFKREDVREQLRLLEKEEYEEARKLWLASGLYWCNYGEVTLAWQQAKKRPDGDLHFHSWHNQPGKVVVRFQTGLPVQDAFSGSSNLLKLSAVPDAAYTSPVRAERRKLARSCVSIRVASVDRKPVWLTLACILHRPLPPDGLIRSASILCDRVGLHRRFKLVLVVEEPITRPATPNRNGTIGIDLGWRRLPTGLRVAFWHDDNGNSGEIILSNYWLNGMTQVDNLRSIRDTKFNEARTTLMQFLARNRDIIPPWLEEQTPNLARNPRHLTAVVWHWLHNRFDGDTDIFSQMNDWRRRENHLHAYEDNLRDRLLRQRREQYRIFAAWIAKNYSIVRLENINLSDIARVKGGHGAGLPQPVRRYRQWAGCSILRSTIQNAIIREGVKYELVEPAYTTQRCHVCGALQEFDAANILTPTCPECGSTYDQDMRAAINISRNTSENCWVKKEYSLEDPQ